MSRFAGKTVIISGATSGIGRAVAIAFGKENARVGVLGRRSDLALEVAAEVTRAGGEGVAMTADVGDREALEAVVTPFLDRAGSLAACINVAGVDRAGLISEASAMDFEIMFRTNTLGVLNLLQLAIPIMRRQTSGAIVTVTSISAQKVTYGNGLYGASKAAASMITKTAAAEEGVHGIRINEVSPGAIDTPMLRGFFAEAQAAGTGWNGDKLKNSLPLRRMGDPGDVATAVLWLCSDEAMHITGACLAVDAGFLLT